MLDYSHKLIALIPCVLFLFLAMNLVPLAGQTDSVDESNPNVNSLRENSDLVSALVDIVVDSGLECHHTTLKPDSPGTQFRSVELWAGVPTLAALDDFFTNLGKRWLVDPVAVKLNVQVGNDKFPLLLKAAIDLHPTDRIDSPPDLRSLFDSVRGLEPYAIGGARQGPFLFQFSYEKSLKRYSLQIVDSSLAGFDRFIPKASQTPFGRSLSFSTMGADPLVTLEMTSDRGHLPTGDFLTLAGKLQKSARIQEVKPAQAKPGQPVNYRYHLSLRESELGGILEVLRNEQGGLEEMELRRIRNPDGNDFAWTGIFSVQRTEKGEWPGPLPYSAAKGSVSGGPLPQISAPWPDVAQIRWTPAGEQVTAEIPLTGGASGPTAEVRANTDVEPLRKVLLAAGYTQSQAPNIPQGQFIFFRGAPGAGFAAGPGPQELGSFSDIARVTRKTKTRAGLRYDLDCHQDQLQELIKRLAPKGGHSLENFEMSLNPTLRTIQISFTTTDKPNPSGQDLYVLIQKLLAENLPWFLPDSALQTGVVLLGLSVRDATFFEIRGKTLKSRRIFSDLFPALQRIPGVAEPFFRQGSYHDSKLGRLMNFAITCGYSKD